MVTSHLSTQSRYLTTTTTTTTTTTAEKNPMTGKTMIIQE
jgi:hypothetical protein